jgi:hypothetical protein
MPNPENPFVTLRRDSGLSRPRFAAAVGLLEATWRDVEQGKPARVPAAIRAALAAWGMAPAALDRLCADYERWRALTAPVVDFRADPV